MLWNQFVEGKTMKRRMDEWPAVNDPSYPAFWAVLASANAICLALFLALAV